MLDERVPMPPILHRHSVRPRIALMSRPDLMVPNDLGVRDLLILAGPHQVLRSNQRVS